jgi:hypothetical protein
MSTLLKAAALGILIGLAGYGALTAWVLWKVGRS